MIKEGFNLYPWSQCKKNKTKQNQNPQQKPHMLQYKKIRLNTSSAHNTNTELCYHSTVLLQSPPYIARAPATLSFRGRK